MRQQIAFLLGAILVSPCSSFISKVAPNAVLREILFREGSLDRVTVLKNSRNDLVEAESCWNPRLRSVIGAVAAAGVAETAYLTWTELAGVGAFCSASGDCGSVLNGPYSTIPGTEVPLAALGLLAYSSVAALSLGPVVLKQTDDDNNRVLLTALTTAMGIFSIFLMTLLFGVLKESCPYCIASAVFSVVMAKLCWIGGALPPSKIKSGLQMSGSSALVAFVAALVLFISNEPPVVATNFAGSPAGGASTLLALEPTAAPPITTTSTPKALELATEMQALDARFYGAFWCSHCFDQKQALGREAMAKIPYIECSKDGLNAQSSLCREKDVPGYPTWEINGKLYPGERALEELQEIVQQARK